MVKEKKYRKISLFLVCTFRVTLASLCALSSAQAFHGGFENFLTWLRKTERKVQRDDPLKLEEEDLKAGLKNLKVGRVTGGRRVGGSQKTEESTETGRQKILNIWTCKFSRLPRG